MYQIWQDIKLISKHRLSVSFPRQNRMFSSWVIKKDLLLKRQKLTFSKWLFQSFPFIKLSGKQHSLMFTARLNWHQTGENCKHDITQTTWSAVTHCKQNPCKSLTTAGQSSTTHIHHHRGCQKVTDGSNITDYPTSRRWLPTDMTTARYTDIQCYYALKNIQHSAKQYLY